MTQNTYMTPLKYTNFNGVKRTTKLYFHLTPREFVDWMLENREQADKLMNDFMNVRGDMTPEEAKNASFNSEDVRIMLRMVKVLAELSYGVPSDDGEVFDKSGLQRFINSAAYDGFRMLLFENPNELEEFFKNLLNEEVIEAFGKQMASVQAEENDKQLAAAPGPSANPREMTREELEQALAAKLGANTPSV